jgi:tetratricopeptide (TPR) repeat protein
MGIIKLWRNFTNQLTIQAINTFFKLSAAGTPETHRSFLVEVLQAIAESEGNPQLPYSLLQQNTDKLNKNFCFVLYGLRSSLLNNAEPETAETLAATLVIFGDLILELPEGKKVDHAEIAIAAYNLALDVYNHEASLEKRAVVQMKLANVYSRRGYGRRSDNQKLAHTLFNDAISVLVTQPSMNQNQFFSTETAEAASVLLETVLQKMQQVAFQCFFEAANSNLENVQNLEFSFDFVNDMGERLQQEIYPILEANSDILNDDFAHLLQQWVSTVLPTLETEQVQIIAFFVGSFSELLLRFPKGNLASNIEIAIAGYQAASQFLPVETNLEEWIGFQVGLSVAYRRRIRDDKAENIERAIEYARQALDKCTRPEHHIEVVQRELAAAYRERIYYEENREENLVQAIYYYNKALEVIKPEVALRDWARIQLNLGNVYADLHWLNRDSENTSTKSEEYFKLAVEYYNKALPGLQSEKTFQKWEWGLTQSNIGNLYLERINGNFIDNRKQAIQCFEKALQVYRREKFPYDWAVTQYSLGLAYRDLSQLQRAIDCFELALEICQPTVYPQECLRAGRNLGNAAFALGRWDTDLSVI